MGWFCSQENQELAATLRKVFSQWIHNGHNDFADKNTILLRVRLTHWVLLSHGRRLRKQQNKKARKNPPGSLSQGDFLANQ